MQTFKIYAINFIGADSGPNYLGEEMGETFEDACEKFFSRKEWNKDFFCREDMRYFGSKLIGKVGLYVPMYETNL